MTGTKEKDAMKLFKDLKNQMGVREDMLAPSDNEEQKIIREKIEKETLEEKEKVKSAGGLYVLATERHESRRIDNQLRGRSGRQGDPGKSAFFLSLEDDLMRIFGSERLDKMLSTLGMKEGEAIVHPWVNKSLEKAQAKVEGRNFEIRKQLLKFDDVMNDQRKVIFAQRLEVMRSEDVSEIIQDMRYQLIDDLIGNHVPPKTYPDQWDMDGLHTSLQEKMDIDADVISWASEEGFDDSEIADRLYKLSDEKMAKKSADFGLETIRNIEKQILLQTIDGNWRDHLLKLEHLRSVVGFRGYAQRDPLNEYKTESFQLFEGMLESLREDVCKKLGQVRPISKEEQEQILAQLAEQQRELSNQNGVVAGNSGDRNELESTFDENNPASWGNPGRNEKCPCGSGKKFKHCHGRF